MPGGGCALAVGGGTLPVEMGILTTVLRVAIAVARCGERTAHPRDCPPSGRGPECPCGRGGAAGRARGWVVAGSALAASAPPILGWTRESRAGLCRRRADRESRGRGRSRPRGRRRSGWRGAVGA
eukprot:5779718-Prymnesium_polylepis.1